jgi:hypothetical protein
MSPSRRCTARSRSSSRGLPPSEHSFHEDEDRPPSPDLAHPLDDAIDDDELQYDSLPDAKLNHLRLTMQCIELLREATHENAGYPDSLLKQITDPLDEAFDFDNADVRLCMEIFIHTQNASRESYELICEAVKRHTPTFVPISWAKMNRNLAAWTGIHLMRYDMCPKGCVGYTADFEELQNCPSCGESRFDPIALALGKKVSRQQFFVMPPAPQLQSRWVHPV